MQKLSSGDSTTDDEENDLVMTVVAELGTTLSVGLFRSQDPRA